MYLKLDESIGDVIGFKIRGDLTIKERDEMIEEIEKTSSDLGRLSLLLEFENLEGAPDALYEDMIFSVRLFETFDRIAGIAAPKWETWWGRFAGLFSTTESRFFTPEQRQQALDWVRRQDKS